MEWRDIKYIIWVLSSTPLQSIFSYHSFPLIVLSEVISIPHVSHLCSRYASDGLLSTAVNMVYPPQTLSYQPNDIKQAKFSSIVSGLCTLCSFLPFSSCLNTGIANVLPLKYFFLPSLPPQAAHPQWFNSHIYVEDPNYLPLSNYPLTSSCNCLVNEFINWSC